MPYPESMVKLIEALAQLPGVGSRTAERFAFYVLNSRAETVEELAALLVKVNGSIHACQVCFNLSQEPVCHICSDPTRDHTLLCVVQDPKDVIALEKAGDYKGVYHVLLGALSPLEGIGPKDLKIKELLERLKQGEVREVVLGTTSDTEGDATATYLARQLKPLKLRVTRIAHGVPVGSALEFVDKATLARAMRYRQEI
ncbi:MAG: Recombination protein RecR [Candidatus Omnitrophica bacterium]|nr:Recombination protein RecR [Candidatus Omnitrophota bacterium]